MVGDLYFYAAVTVTIMVVYKVFLSRKHNYPPSLRALPIIGHLHLLKPPLYLYMEKVSQKLGPVLLFWMGKQPLLVISSPQAFEECFTKYDVLFASRPKTMAGDLLTFNYTFLVFAPHGELWKALRRLAFIEIFSPKALGKSSIVREQEVRHFLGRLYRSAADNGKGKADMKNIISLLAASVIMRLAVGKRYVAVADEETSEEARLLELFKDLFFPLVNLNICDAFPFLRAIGYKGVEKKMIKLANNRDVFLSDLVREFRDKQAVGNLDEHEQSSVLSVLLSLQKSDPDFYTEDIVKGVIMMMFIAGTETSAAALEWGLTLLMQHPEKMEKVQREIDSEIGADRLMTEADFPKLRYLSAVVKEALRLYPPAPLLLPHWASKECNIGGYEIPQGAVLMVNAWAMHRDPKLWDDPNSFIPERFLDSDVDGNLFVPFGVGRRACPGAGMGTHIVTLAIGLLVQCFSWDRISSDEDMSHAESTVTLIKRKPLEAAYVPRPHMLPFLKGF